MNRALSTFILSAAVITFAQAQEHRDQEHRDQQQPQTAQTSHDEQRHQQSRRYYDKSGRDYHEWNQDEDRRYHEYAKERHMPDREFGRLKPKQQSDYFQWSHQRYGQQSSGDHDGSREHDSNNRR